MMEQPLTGCRSCNRNTRLILPMGDMVLSNALVAPEDLDQPEARYPLNLVFCPGCALVQIAETAPLEKLFRNYLYYSSFADTMLAHAKSLAHRMVAFAGLTRDSLVVEIGSNDGYLLQYFVEQGVPVLGIEPAMKIAETARGRGIPTRSEFFTPELASQLQQEMGKGVDVILINNVHAHEVGLNEFMSGVSALLGASGIAVMEWPYVKDMIDRFEFDTIYHEHLCFFSLTSLKALLERHGLQPFDVERTAIHGGSLRVFSAHTGSRPTSGSVQALLTAERNWGVHSPEFYAGFVNGVRRIKESLYTLLRDLKRDGKRIAAYGASAKGTILLNYCGVGEFLDFVVDRNPHKQGLHMPGVHLPIHEPAYLIQEMPEYTLLLTWNFADEILVQQQEYRKRGGKFVIPVPEVTIV